VGNGEGAALHSPRYDFNDAILAPAAAFWTRLAGAFLQ
jgi:hippurate hydrolase